MNYEEKYKKALEIAKDWKSGLTGNGDLKMCLDELFPELAESEDEKIRKEIIEIFKSAQRDGICKPIKSEQFEKIFSWLEKQNQGIWLPHVVDRKTIEDYAYQCAYDLSNDWAKDSPTWKDVETACKLGIRWCEEHQKPSELK